MGSCNVFCSRWLFIILTVIVPLTYTKNWQLMSKWIRPTYQPGTGCTHIARETITSLSASENENKEKTKLLVTYLFWTLCAFLSPCINTVSSYSFFHQVTVHFTLSAWYNLQQRWYISLVEIKDLFIPLNKALILITFITIWFWNLLEYLH